MTDDPPLPPRPRQARGLAARSAVYAAAMDEFAERGAAAARVEDIVERAGVSWGTFYRWFPRKQDVLLEGAARHVRAHMAPAVEAGLADPDRPASATALDALLALLEPREHPPALHGEMLGEVIQQRERFTALLDDGEQPLLAQVARIVGHGQQRGELRTDVDAFTLAGTLLAGTVFVTSYAYYGPLRGHPKARPEGDLAGLVGRLFGICWRGLERDPARLD